MKNNPANKGLFLRFPLRMTANGLLILAMGLAACLAAGFSACASGDEEEALYRQAITALDKGLRDEATEHLTRFLVRYPRSSLVPEVLWQRGTIAALYRDDYLSAITDFRELLRVAPRSDHAHEAQKSIAEIFERKLDNRKRAIVEYQRLISDFATMEGDDEYQLRIARCYYELLDFDQAIMEFQILIDRYPASPLVREAYYQIATVLQTSGALEPAEDAWKAYIKRFPKDDKTKDAQFGLGSTLEEQGRLEEALEIYKDLYAEYPSQEVVAWRIEKVTQRLKDRGR